MCEAKLSDELNMSDDLFSWANCYVCSTVGVGDSNVCGCEEKNPAER